MTAFEFALFAHLLGVVTLFAAIALVETAGARLRRAASVEHVRLWVEQTRSAGALFPVALVALLGGGLFMTADAWTFTTPWVVVALTTVVVLGGVGGGVQGQRLATIGRSAAAAHDGPVPQHLAELIAAPALWVAVVAPDVATVGILWTMATKPGWIVSIVAVTGLATVGTLTGYVLSARQRERTITAHLVRQTVRHTRT